MVMSMTGFGRSERDGIVVEIRSVNHRYFDFHTRIPQPLLKLEEKIKKICQQYVVRGRVDCSINISTSVPTNRGLHIDWNLLDEYYQFINNLKERYQLHEEIGITHFLQHDGLISVIEQEVVNPEMENTIIIAVEEAVQQLRKMRIIEGKALQNEIANYLELMDSFVQEIFEAAPIVKVEYEEKLRKKICEYTSGLFDETRVLTEVAIFADKIDISEELTRLNSHINQFRKSLNSMEPIGRKCDFLVQEMNREVNTIAAKANHANITNKVVELKSIIEKIREQVQNIE
ncbi:YicC/YloC family endoribonuclease [Caldifermentibacillus hisashii]|uniref:YicC/YloC family endoribonuclease n=1 Tax=Caldifermentibacillus hisashii TaxID=996558 RepID=UPI0031FBE9D3